MKSIPLLALVLFAVSLHSNAETVININSNMLRGGDVLHKQQVEYKDPGRNGRNVIWDFSRLDNINDDYVVRYLRSRKSKPDSVQLSNIEHLTKYNYLLVKDSLFLCGYENSGSKYVYQNPLLVLKYPFSYGDSVGDSFSGIGTYKEMLSIDTRGNFSSVVDASGTLILPEKDTLFNTIRVINQQSYSQITSPIGLKQTLANQQMDSLSLVAIDSLVDVESDTLFLRSVTCKWYAPGYRYPVFETFCNYSHAANDTVEKMDLSTAFYFPASLHQYLESDDVNVAILDSISKITETGDEEPDVLPFDFNYFPNPVQTDLNIELLLNYPSNVTFRLCDASGNVEKIQDEGFFQEGLHFFTLGMSNLRPGIHLLYFYVNEHVMQTTVIKK
jgi:hypothetical protein